MREEYQRLKHKYSINDSESRTTTRGFRIWGIVRQKTADKRTKELFAADLAKEDVGSTVLLSAVEKAEVNSPPSDVLPVLTAFF
jgi:hypothetical protein